MLAAAIQMEPVVGDMAENLRHAELLVNEAAAAGSDWMVRHQHARLAVSCLPDPVSVTTGDAQTGRGSLKIKTTAAGTASFWAEWAMSSGAPRGATSRRR